MILHGDRGDGDDLSETGKGADSKHNEVLRDGKVSCSHQGTKTLSLTRILSQSK